MFLTKLLNKERDLSHMPDSREEISLKALSFISHEFAGLT